MIFIIRKYIIDRMNTKEIETRYKLLKPSKKSPLEVLRETCEPTKKREIEPDKYTLKSKYRIFSLAEVTEALINRDYQQKTFEDCNEIIYLTDTLWVSPKDIDLKAGRSHNWCEIKRINRNNRPEVAAFYTDTPLGRVTIKNVHHLTN
jgi:hypothetical protein